MEAFLNFTNVYALLISPSAAGSMDYNKFSLVAHSITSFSLKDIFSSWMAIVKEFSIIFISPIDNCISFSDFEVIGDSKD